jgi:hypothetical protein
MNMLRLCPVSWEAEKDGSCILWQAAKWSGYYWVKEPIGLCHNIQLPSFSASHNIEHHLGVFISDSLIMAF